MKKIILGFILLLIYGCSTDEDSTLNEQNTVIEEPVIKPIFIGKYDISKEVFTPVVYNVEIDIYGVEKRYKLAPYQFSNIDILFKGKIELVTRKEKKFLNVNQINSFPTYFEIVNEKNGVFEIENGYSFINIPFGEQQIYIGPYNPTVDFSVENKITQIIEYEVPSSNYFVKKIYRESIYTY